MLFHYLKTFYRNQMKYKSSSIINLVSLTIGVCGFVLIMQYVQYEMSFDDFHENGKSIYRIIWSNSKGNHNSKSPTALGPFLRGRFPEIEQIVRVNSFGSTVHCNGKQLDESGLLVADSPIFEIFNFNFITGDPTRVLDKPNSIAISEELATKYFAQENPLDRMMEMNNSLFTIRAVYRDLPQNSSIRPRAVVSVQSSKSLSKMDNHWGNNLVTTFILAKPETDPTQLEKSINEQSHGVRKKWGDPDLPFRLQPFLRMHLYSEYDYAMETDNGGFYTIMISLAVALFILLTGSVNFINISISQLAGRLKEFGLRTVLGANTRQVIIQFWAELLSLALLAIALAFLLLKFMIPGFNLLMNTHLSWQLDQGTLWNLLLIFLYLAALIIVFSASFLIGKKGSAIQLAEIKFGGTNKFTRTMLISQFAISVFFFSCTAMFGDQIGYMFNRHKIPVNERIIEIRMKSFNKFNLQDQRSIDDYYTAVKSNPIFISSTTDISSIRVMEFELNNKKFIDGFRSRAVGFFETFGMKILQGRDFSPQKFSSDTVSSVIVNQTFCRIHNLTNPLGQTIKEQNRSFHIIGVVEDMPARSLRYEIGSAMYSCASSTPGKLFFKVKKDMSVQTIALLKKEWQQRFPEKLFSYAFFDDIWRHEYAQDIRMRELLQYAAWAALLLACLGVFGLSSVTLAKRTKEIGVRKVVGASDMAVFYLLIKEYIWLIFISTIIAAPFFYYFMRNWLQNFSYHIEVNWGFVAASSFASLLTILLTVGYKTFRAAKANPVESLRCE